MSFYCFFFTWVCVWLWLSAGVIYISSQDKKSSHFETSHPQQYIAQNRNVDRCLVARKLAFDRVFWLVKFSSSLCVLAHLRHTRLIDCWCFSIQLTEWRQSNGPWLYTSVSMYELTTEPKIHFVWRSIEKSNTTILRSWTFSGFVLIYKKCVSGSPPLVQHSVCFQFRLSIIFT